MKHVLGWIAGALIFAGPAAAATLVEQGQPTAVLVVADQAEPDELTAAEEIRTHLQQISGAELPIVRASAARAGDAAIELRIGQAADPALEAAIRAQGSDPAGFALRVTDQRIDLRGLSAEGTLFGAYELLEQLGVRWFLPGELGTVIPEQKTVRLDEGVTIQTPDFSSRHLQAVPRGELSELWYRRLRLGGPYFPGAHGFPGMVGHAGDALFEAHPEYYSLNAGERTRRQFCLSNPGTLAVVVEATKAYFRKHPDAPWIGIGPNDGSGHCECDGCTALDAGDPDPFSSSVSKTDRYIWFFNQVLQGLEDEFPDKKLGFYSYSSYTKPPVREKPDPRIVPAFAPITLCRIHGMDNPLCPERSYYHTLMRQWGELVPQTFERGYLFNLADPGLPFSKLHAMRKEVPIARELGIIGWRIETVPHWAAMTPTIYLTAKLFWDADADPDALVRDFAEHFFGPAAAPMHAYLVLMDAALRDGDYHSGSSFDMPQFYPASLRQEAASLLAQAKAAAAQEIHARRVELFQLNFDYLEAFVAMIEQRAEHDYVASQQALDRFKQIQHQLIESYDVPMLSPRAAASYTQRFFAQATEQGRERVTGGNTFVVGLADEWDFLLDPMGVGELIGLHEADARGGNWRPIRTSTTTWSNEGLRYYKGEAWYRQVVSIPETYADQRIFLWFGGVDEQAKVWLNGQEIGISHNGAFIPFELDATPAIRPGQANVVTVRISNRRLDELGMGGIMAPVMFYAPAEGDQAQLHNARELPAQFPLY